MESWILRVSCKVNVKPFGLHLLCKRLEVFMIPWTFQTSNLFLKQGKTRVHQWLHLPYLSNHLLCQHTQVYMILHYTMVTWNGTCTDLRCLTVFRQHFHASLDRTSDRPDLDPKCGNLHLVPSILIVTFQIIKAQSKICSSDNSFYAG